MDLGYIKYYLKINILFFDTPTEFVRNAVSKLKAAPNFEIIPAALIQGNTE